MLLPKCPSCHAPIPLREVFRFNVVCPVCNSELVPNRWCGGLWVLVITSYPDLARYLGEHLGFSPTRIMSTVPVRIACYLAINLLAWMVLIRYRVKDPPLSIVSKPNA